MTHALLCNGCLDFETIDRCDDSLIISENNSNEVYHLCIECTKKFHKFLKSIEEKTP